MKKLRHEYNVCYHELFNMRVNAKKHCEKAEREYKNEIKRLKDAEYKIESARNNLKKYGEEYEALSMIENHTDAQKCRFETLHSYLKVTQCTLYNAKLERNRLAANIQYSLKPKYHSARNRESTFLRMYDYVGAVIDGYINQHHKEELEAIESWSNRADLRYKITNDQNINIQVYDGEFTVEEGYLAYEVNVCGKRKITFERA